MGDPGYSMKNNPYWVANEMNHGMKKQRYMANASLKYEILDWLDVTGRVRIDNATNDYSDKEMLLLIFTLLIVLFMDSISTIKLTIDRLMQM